MLSLPLEDEREFETPFSETLDLDELESCALTIVCNGTLMHEKHLKINALIA